MRLLTEDGTLVVPDERLVERGYRYGVVVGRVLVKQFQSPEDAEECATALAGVAMDLLSAPDSDSDVAANNVSEEPFGCGREVSDAALGLSAIDDNRVDVMTALRLVADGDESAPAVVGAGGEVSTQLKTGDYLVNAIAGGETVVEGLLHVGDVYILGSDDKVGKTRTSHVAAYGVAAGRGFLDWPVPRARDVLFIEQDESEEDTGNTLSDAVELGLVSESDLRSGAVSYYNDFDANGFRTAHRCFAFDDGMSKDLEGGTRILTDRGLGKVISDWRGTHGNGRLVVIDCLSDVIDERHGLGLSVREDKATMAALSALAHELRVALLIVHHTTKWQADGSVADRLQGTRGVTAGATGTMLFQPDYEHGAWTGGGTLTVKGRCVPRSVPIVSERGFWRSISRESPEAYRPDEVVRAVHSWMMSRGSDWSGRPKELVGLASLPCDYRHLTKRLRAGREWMSRNGVEYSLGRLRGGYRSVTLALTDAGAEASRVKRSSFRGFETVARDGFGEGVTCTYEPAVTG
ncbi:MAG: AAA family ATPase [Coriobacteriales bacterium]|nr:AAA family ATPase [Coriobacteriales bacterium]